MIIMLHDLRKWCGKGGGGGGQGGSYSVLEPRDITHHVHLDKTERGVWEARGEKKGKASPQRQNCDKNIL